MGERKVSTTQRRMVSKIFQPLRNTTNKQPKPCEETNKDSINTIEHHETMAGQGSGSDIDIDEIDDMASPATPHSPNHEQHSSESEKQIELWIVCVRRDAHKAEDSVRQHGLDSWVNTQRKDVRETHPYNRDTPELQSGHDGFPTGTQ